MRLLAVYQYSVNEDGTYLEEEYLKVCSIINTSDDISLVKVDRQADGGMCGRANEFQCPSISRNKAFSYLRILLLLKLT